MNIFENLESKTTSLIEVIKQTGIRNLFVYVCFISVFTGFLYGAFQFIERQYASGYYLDILSKLTGLVYTGSWLSLYNVFFGFIVAIILSLLIYIFIKLYDYLKENNKDIIYSLMVPVLALAIIDTVFIADIYFIDRNNAFTQYVLFNHHIAYLMLFKLCAVVAFLISSVMTIYLVLKKNNPLVKTFLLSFFGLFLIFSGFMYAANKDNAVLNYLNGFYQQLITSYDSNWMPVILVLFVILYIFWLVGLPMLIIVLPELWKNKVFKLIIGLVLYTPFYIAYMFVANYFINQSFYVKTIGEIHLYISLLALIYLNFGVIYAMYFARITPALFTKFQYKKLVLVLVLLIGLVTTFFIIFKPTSNMLKAYVDQTSILQKHLTKSLMAVLFNEPEEKNFVIPEKYLCIKNPKNPQLAPVKKKPDIILISVDALRTDFALNKELAPNINKLFNQSYTFVNNYSHATHTPASVSSIATSKYFAAPITALEPTLASILVQNGYKTMAFVGIDLTHGKLIMDTTYINDKKYPSPIIKGYQVVQIPKNVEKETDKKMLELALRAIKAQNNEEPLLIWLHVYQLHETPVTTVFKCFLSDKPFKKEYSRRLVSVDKIVGQFILALKEKDLYNDSLVALFADHGEEIKEHMSFFHSFSLYNELIRVPLAIKLPGQTKGEMVKVPASTLDLVPTILEYTGIDTNQFNFCGENLIVNEKPLSRSTLPLASLYRGYYNSFPEAKVIPSAVLMNKKPLRYHVRLLHKHAMIDQNNEWKMIYTLDPEYFELYNLKTDPQEKHNLADEHPEILKMFISKLESQLRQYK